MTPTPGVGAIGLVRTGGIAGAVIRVVTRSKVNHAFVYVGGGDVVEAIPSGARITPVSKYRFVDWHEPPAGKGIAMACEARALVGIKYGFLDLVSIGLLQYHIRPDWVRRVVARQDRLICSQLCDLAASRTRVQLFPLGTWEGDVTPGDLSRLGYPLVNLGT